MKHRLALAAAALLALARAASSQTNTTQPEGVLFPTQDSGRINGVRLQVQPDGSVWFLEATSDSIAYLKDGVIKRWQIRTNEQIGANPVDDSLKQALLWLHRERAEARSTAPAAATPAWTPRPASSPSGSSPARSRPPSTGPSGLVWFPQSGAVMQSFNPDTLEVINWRSTAT
jgi:streptogramin lyase